MLFNITISGDRLKLTPRLPSALYEVVRKKTSYTFPGFAFTTAHKEHGWDGIKRLFWENHTAPAGLYQRIDKILREQGHTVSINFTNNYLPTGTIEAFGLNLAEFQIIAVKNAVKFRYGVIAAKIRAGKTAIIGALCNHINQYPICIVTKFRDVVRQTQNAIAEHTGKHVGFFSESLFEPGDIWVTSYDALTAIDGRKNVSKKLMLRNEELKKLIKRTRVLLLDECDLVLATRTKASLLGFTSIGYKIGLSGTPKRDVAALLELEAAVGPVIAKVSYKKLIDEGRLVQPLVHVYELPSKWYNHYVAEFNDSYEANIVNNELRNRFIAVIVEELAKRKKSVIVFVSRLEHGKILSRMINSSCFVQGLTDTDLRFELYNSLQEKKIKCLVATVGKRGLNLPKLDAVINAEGWAEGRNTQQKMRSLTASKGKSVGLIIDFLDKGPFIFKQSIKRYELYASLKGFKVFLKQVPNNYFTSEGVDHEEILGEADGSGEFSNGSNRSGGSPHPPGVGETAGAEPTAA